MGCLRVTLWIVKGGKAKISFKGLWGNQCFITYLMKLKLKTQPNDLEQSTKDGESPVGKKFLNFNN